MSFAVRCCICQVETRKGENWFLLVENDWEDRLKILPWSEALAQREGMHAVCSPSHVQQLVAHWMATGSLDYPFARVGSGSTSTFWLSNRIKSPDSAACPDRIQALGELAIDRESLNRVLLENPEALVPLLDALMRALATSPRDDLSGFSLAEDDLEGGNLVQLRHGQPPGRSTETRDMEEETWKADRFAYASLRTSSSHRVPID